MAIGALPSITARHGDKAVGWKRYFKRAYILAKAAFGDKMTLRHLSNGRKNSVTFDIVNGIKK